MEDGESGVVDEVGEEEGSRSAEEEEDREGRRTRAEVEDDGRLVGNLLDRGEDGELIVLLVEGREIEVGRLGRRLRRKKKKRAERGSDGQSRFP